ncbi:LacI family DNA-binding transcriptional regulator [Pseudoduganella sp. LjRoot289]|uniref:LacI family DNA-binding transcriptional regulator n=1 Tax=Pseudoduganella sp. LjRoot289 TaxID=3342314 RepID=UPI003ECD8EC1
MIKPKPPNAPSSITLHDVAAHAGVSAMTASRALSGEGAVSRRSKSKVMASAAALDYVPNVSARVMRGARSHVLGIMLNDLTSAHLSAIVMEISKAVRSHNRDLVIYNMFYTNEAPREGSSVNLLGGVCDGFLVLQGITDTLLRVLEKSTKPIVLVNFWRAPTSLPVVRADNFVSARDAVRHLIELGHKRIAFIGGTQNSGQSNQRLQGYMAALAEQGIQPAPQWLETGNFSHLSGLEAGKRLLNLRQRPTAIFAVSDMVAFGVMEAARAAGLRLPQDLSIVGYDDTEAAALTDPPLTSIRPPLQRLAEAAVQELIARIENSSEQHSCIELPSQVVIRASTARCPIKR